MRLDDSATPQDKPARDAARKSKSNPAGKTERQSPNKPNKPNKPETAGAFAAAFANAKQGRK